MRHPPWCDLDFGNRRVIILHDTVFFPHFVHTRPAGVVLRPPTMSSFVLRRPSSFAPVFILSFLFSSSNAELELEMSCAKFDHGVLFEEATDDMTPLAEELGRLRRLAARIMGQEGGSVMEQDSSTTTSDEATSAEITVRADHSYVRLYKREAPTQCRFVVSTSRGMAASWGIAPVETSRGRGDMRTCPYYSSVASAMGRLGGRLPQHCLGGRVPKREWVGVVALYGGVHVV